MTRNDAGEFQGVNYDRLTAVLAAVLQESHARCELEFAAFPAASTHRDALFEERLRALEFDAKYPHSP